MIVGFTALVAMALPQKGISQTNKTTLAACDTLTDAQVSDQVRKQFFRNNREDAFYLYKCALERFSSDQSEIREFIDFHHDFATALRNAGANDLAIKHARKAFEISNKFYSKKLGIHRSTVRFGNQFLLGGYADSALYYYQKAHEGISNVRKGPSLANSFNNIGMAYALAGNHEEALAQYEKAKGALRLFPKFKKSGLYLAIRDNEVRSHRYVAPKLRLIQVLDTFQHDCFTYGSEGRKLKCCLLLSQIYLELGQFEKVAHFLKILDESQPNSKFNSAEVLNVRQALAKETETWALFGRYTDLGQKQADSLSKLGKRFLELIISAQPQYDAAIRNMEIRMASLERAKNDGLVKQHKLSSWIKRLVGFVAFVLVSSLIIILVFRNRQNVLKKEKLLISKVVEEKEVHLAELEQEISTRKNDVENLALYLNVLRNLRSDFQETIQNTIEESTGENKNALRKLLISDKSTEQIGSKTDVLYQNLTNISGDFYDRLRSSFPELSQLELELCGYIKAGLGNKEIAHVRNISPKSVRMSRYRLRKKMTHSEHSEIQDFIQRI